MRKPLKTPPSPTVLAWHFLAADRHTRREPGYPPPVEAEVGKTLVETRPLEMCVVGLHASIRPLDALYYAPGPVACRVRMSGDSVTHPEHLDKLCYAERTVLAMADASTVLREFACWCAEAALTAERERGREPDPSCWAVIEAKRAWMRGEITDQDLAAARDAAWNAASVARDAARGAWNADKAAWKAAWAAWYAAWDTAWNAAWAAAAARGGVSAATSTAAWAAAAATGAVSATTSTAARADEDTQNGELERRLSDLLGMAKDTPERTKNHDASQPTRP